MLLKFYARECQENYDSLIVLAKQNNRVLEMSDEIKSLDNIEFITLKDKEGFAAYRRSIQFLMIKSFYKVVGKENIDNLMVLFSLGNGLYCEAKGNFELTDDLIHKVKEKMDYIVSLDIPIKKKIIGKEDALKLFHDYRMFEKEKLFKYRRVSKITLHSMGNFDDYFYGDLVDSTGILGGYDLQKYKDGFLLVLPTRNDPYTPAYIPTLDNMYQCLKQSTEWSKSIGIHTVGDLNNAVVEKKIDDLILMQEAYMEKQIANIAEDITSKKNIKFVMIAGPSSSGKTSFSHRLSLQLKAMGLKPHPIAVDDYFINHCDIIPDENGKIDLESIDIVDTKKFNEDMLALLNGEKVEIPSYNFQKGEREYKGHFIQLGENDILIIEGIHCLNDKMSYALDSNNKYRIYISALTPLNIDEHNRVSSSDLRLLRIISRDDRTRGASPTKTISMWSSVRSGEEKNIFPYQENANVIFNSSLIYELLVVKAIAEPLLFSVNNDCEEYFEAKRLLKFLDFFLSYNDKTVPIQSLLKEFVGGSYFNV
jgi:uridine kinase